MRPRELKRSRIGCATAKAVSAPAASFSPRALSTFFTAVRSIERWLALRALRTTVCLARFLADLMFATANSWKLVREIWDCGKSDRKVWTIQWVASTWPGPTEPGPAGRASAAGGRVDEWGAVALHNHFQRDDVHFARLRAGAGPDLCGGVRGQSGHGRLRGGLPDPQLHAPALGRGLVLDGLRAGA